MTEVKVEIIKLAKLLARVLKEANKEVDRQFPDRVANIVKTHSTGAAAAAVASGWVPGVGAMAAATISAGFIWTMYGKINSECRIPFTENVMKSLASGVATNLVAYVAGGLVISTAFSFFPGLGSVGASVIIGATCYALTLVSGGIYIKLLTTMIKEGVDPMKVQEAELKRRAQQEADSMDVGAALKQAKSAYKK